MIPFAKYQGAGNDFILIDARATNPVATWGREEIARACDRHFGIGADGLMLLQNHPDYDFEMLYYNSDGRPSTMCGNGGRCILRFARDLGIEREEYRFLAVDGPHRARFTGELVSLEMSDVRSVKTTPEGDKVLDTGSPHYVRFVAELPEDVVTPGRAIRSSEPYLTDGINVNFVSRYGATLRIATYERGVEDETLACGTGVTAAVLASREAPGAFDVKVKARGGDLSVRGSREADGSFRDVWLTGPAEFVFSGEI